MSDRNKYRNNTRDNDNDAKTNEIEETLENASDKIVTDSKKEAKQIGDSDREQLYRLLKKEFVTVIKS